MSSRKIILIFLPALLVGAFGLFIQILRYEPLYPKTSDSTQKNQTDIPIFDEDPILGNRRAGPTVIIFGDLGCDSCREQFTLMEDVIAQYPKQVKVIWKNIPITRFPISSETAHAYAYCAEEQEKFTAFVNALLGETDILREDILPAAAREADVKEKDLATCLASGRPQAYQARTEELAKALNIQEAPSIFFEGFQIPTPKSIDQWIAFLNLEPSTP